MVRICEHKLHGVCAQEVQFKLDNEKIYAIQFKGGCNGNLKALSRLADGMEARDVAAILRELRCGTKLTSCGDQFARAIDKELS
jgi:uncharacterized protein (TIGR03905 family)